MSIAAMNAALEALTEHGAPYLRHGVDWDNAITVLRAAIAEQEKAEPVAIYEGKEGEYGYETITLYEDIPAGTDLFTHPAPVPAGWQLVPVEQFETMQQAIIEMRHAFLEPNWFTDGKVGANRQFILWMQKGVDAMKQIATAPKPGEMK